MALVIEILALILWKFHSALILKNDFNSHEKSYEICYSHTPHYKMLSFIWMALCKNPWHTEKKKIQIFSWHFLNKEDLTIK